MLHIDIHQKRYEKTSILENVNIYIENSGLYGVVGKNGSGKTTFFKCLNHLTTFDGKILLNKEQLKPEKIAFIPTEPYLYEHLTIEEFYRFFALLTNIPLCKDFIFDIDKNMIIKELSTGMRKKVYINAVFQKSYEVYIFDEPFNGLDIESVYELRKLIQNLSQNHIVFVSSHILESLNNCDVIFVEKNKNLQKIFQQEYSLIEKILFEN